MIKTAIRAAILAVRKIYILPIKLYRKFLSPGKGMPTCRFTPTCSQYAMEAVMEWGIVIGTVLALWRLIRCNPFSKGGYDPVPKLPRRDRNSPPSRQADGKKTTIENDRT